jgi:mannose-6-phosphate isomerase-like protein (cupin superfamily)
MPDDAIVIRHATRPQIAFAGGALYCPVIGDDNGADLPLRTGIQTSPPGYTTRPHAHPYVELLTVLSGKGEAWIEGLAAPIKMEPGITIAVPANRVHGFRTLGDRPLVTLGIHASDQRIVVYHDTAPAG